jgi:hypothetical protein
VLLYYFIYHQKHIVCRKREEVKKRTGRLLGKS